MNLSPKNISFIVVAIGVIVGWNAFLIQRDDDMFRAYYKQQAIENLKRPPTSEIR
jgi:hypothetical protein